MTTKAMRPCPRCQYWHTLVDGFYRHVQPSTACKYVMTALPASPVATAVWEAIAAVMDAQECGVCGEPFARELLDEHGNCAAHNLPTEDWREER